jgi:hypothetical protein
VKLSSMSYAAGAVIASLSLVFVALYVAPYGLVAALSIIPGGPPSCTTQSTNESIRLATCGHARTPVPCLSPPPIRPVTELNFCA